MRTTSEITHRLLFEGTRILVDHPEGLAVRELWPLILERLPGIEQEWDTVRIGTTTADVNFRFYSIELVKAGWIHKSERRWHLTWIGREALDRWQEPTGFFRAVHERYAYWDRNKERFELAKRLVAAIPEGQWLAHGDLAEETVLEDERLVFWLQGERPEGWHRVLNDNGSPPMATAEGHETQQWRALLAEDGISMAQGRADASRQELGTDLRQLVIEPADDDTEAPQRAWLVRGSNVQGENLIRTLWLPNGVCSLPASRLRDLPAGSSAEQVRTAIDTDYSHANTQDRARLTAEYHAFLSRIRDGDLVLTNDGSAVYIGVITGAPAFVQSIAGRANLERPVDWRNADKPLDYVDDLPDEFAAKVSNPDAEVIELTDFIEDLQRLIDRAPPVVSRELRLPDVTAELAKRLLVEEDWLQECVELLRERAQLIFYGPPGTGKTYLAQHLAGHLTGGKPENVQLVQFHPAYSYEDFFEGYRPKKSNGGVVFDIVHGPLRRLATAATTHPGEPYVLIIDEINRGNLAKIFGELYFLLEYRTKAVNLLYGDDDGKGFSLPRNLIILATMNTADRSIALVDAAMRRRFWFMELHPDEPPARDMLNGWLAREGHADEPARLLAELNSRIDDRDFRIGPSYLMRDSATTDEGLRRIWRTQILPLLEEHHYGDGTDVKQRYGLDALRAGLR
jgi:5-methylcytosine-specific restriction protein B